MPAGVSWSKYLKAFSAAMLSMFAGAQVVHMFYKPLDDLDSLVMQEIEKRQKDNPQLLGINSGQNVNHTRIQ